MYTGCTYTSPDGARHLFFTLLHDGGNDAGDNSDGTLISYTRDGTYLRMRWDDVSATRVIEFPDGQKSKYVLNWDNSWRLAFMYNGFSALDASGNPVTNYVRFDFSGPTNDIVITDSVTDANGNHRKQIIHYDSTKHIQSIELAAFDHGTPAVYGFTYETAAIAKPAYPATGSPTANVTLLTRLTLPTAETYEFSYLRASDVQNDSGVLVEMVLPTKGEVHWDYSAYNVASLGNPLSAGVWKRRVYAYNQAASPQYSLEQYTTYYATLGQNVVQTMKGWTDSSGSGATPAFRTTSYFNAYDGISLDELGLPYTMLIHPSGVDNPVGGLYLSTLTEDCTPTCSLQRATYLAYEFDPIPDCSASGDFVPCRYDRNRRVKAEDAEYLSDGPYVRGASVHYSDFDGLGHYRTAQANGTFPTYSGYNPNVRLITRNYNPTVGTFCLDSDGNVAPTCPDGQQPFAGIPPYYPWVLSTYSFQKTVENGLTNFVETCFDTTRNFLRIQRKLLANSGTEVQQGSDLLSRFTPDADGNVAREEYFGGDDQAMFSGLVPFPPDCTVNTSHTDHTYRIDNTFVAGTLATSRYYDQNGSPLSFLRVDQTVDPWTGLVKSSRDTAGIQTAYSFDALGRLTWIKPDPGQGAWTQYDYRTVATATNNKGRAEVLISQFPNQSTTSPLARSSVEYDGMGRMFRQTQLLSDNTWSATDTRYDFAGRRSAVSATEAWPGDAGTPGHWTTTLYDAFSRPTSITAPDGKQTSLFYTGARVVQRNTPVATGPTETSTYHIEEYDRFGRIFRVTEGLSPATMTEYQYGPGDRLSLVHSAISGSGSSWGQERRFTYDGRGFLREETNPEYGMAGNVTYVYSYDALGHLRGKNLMISYAVDRAERVTSVSDQGGTLKTFSYEDFNSVGDYKQGKLKSATRYKRNREGVAGQVAVTDAYVYGGVGGRISSKTTSLNIAGSTVGSYTQGTSWDDLGNIAAITYPGFSGCPSCPGRTVTDSFSNGFLTRVAGYTSDSANIKYYPNGLLQEITHANGVLTQQVNDPFMMTRPYEIRTLNAGTNWDSGAYQYDGAGNVKSIGADYYYYDASNRLVEDGSSGVTRQKYEYDAYGNQTHPTIYDLSPRTGAMAGGTVVTITGDSFVPGSTIQFGNSAPVGATFISSTQLTCVTPATGVEGPASVAIVATGFGTRFSGPSFWYMAPSCPRGDANGDGQLTSADVIYLSNYVSGSGPAPVCNSDVNGDGVVNSADVSYLRSGLFGVGELAYVTSATNRISTSNYQDDNGSTTADSNGNYGWDEIGTMRSSTGLRNWSFVYDANDERVGRWDRSTGQWKWTLRGLGNEVLREVTSGGAGEWWSWGTDYVYRGSSLLASDRPSGRHYYHLDHLGSPRLVTDSSGNAATYKYAPFGTELTSVYPDAESLKFTAQERDGTSSYLDYMHARYYRPDAARFLSVDPHEFWRVDPKNPDEQGQLLAYLRKPQSWNRYTYVLNNPINLTDPTGETWRDSFGYFFDWLLGRGPEHKVFVPPSNEVKDLQQAPEVNRARQEFRKKNSTNIATKQPLQPLTNFKGKFGVAGLIKAGTNSTQQFVGSYSVDIRPEPNGTVRYTVTNTTSFKSLMYGVMPDWNRSTLSPAGNVDQVYTWTEPPP